MDKNKENIEITEQDVFNFVFFKESLSLEKQEIIENDIAYKDMLDFYIALKNNTVEKPNEKLKRILANQIPAYSFDNVIHLYRLKDPIQKQNGNRLAADSKELKPKMTTRSFVDNNKEYLIKVLNYGGQTKVFVFSTKDEVVKNFDIIIDPHNLKYHFDDNSEPLKIEQNIDAEKIEIRFN